jgi:hypothetical protein
MNAPSPISSGSERAPQIARVWHGVTPTAKAELDLEPFVLHYDIVAAP